MSEATFDQTQNIKEVKTLKETDRKCPQCGATMDYDPATGGMFCPYCDYHEEIKPEAADGESVAQELDFDKAEFTGNCDWGVEQKTVTCKSCGAVTVYDALEVANVCPYCGSNQVMEASDVKTLAPNGVIPFAVTSKTAGERFSNWLRKKWFAPRAAKESAKADAFEGIYLPSWTFDADTSSDYTGEFGKDRRIKDGDKTKTVTDWFPTSGHLDHFIDDELVPASTEEETELVNSVAPFETNGCKAYKPEYMAGFKAIRYTVGLKDAWEKAKGLIRDKLRGLVETKIRNEHHADRARNVQLTTTYSNIKYKYIMLPVWISAFKYKDKTYRFMVNGQTGKVGGKYPISPVRVAIAVILVLLVIILIWKLSN